MGSPPDDSTMSPLEAGGGERSPDGGESRPAGESSASVVSAAGDVSSDPTSDTASDQSRDSLANSDGADSADSELYGARRERQSPSKATPPAATHQALNVRVRLPMSVQLPAAPGSSRDSARDSAATSDSDSKGTTSGDSLTYVTPDEYVRHIYPRPARTRDGHGARSRDRSFSSESPELYFQRSRSYDRRSYGGLCLSMSIVAVIVAVIGIVSVAAYLGVVTNEDGQALKYEAQYSGQFQVLRGDYYHPSLDDAESDEFKRKAARYQKMLERLYEASYIAEAFRHADVRAFAGDALTVFFRIHLDRRKIPKSILNTEEALRDVLTQEVMALEPRAFRTLDLDINSIRIARQKNGVSTSPARGGGGGAAAAVDGPGPEQGRTRPDGTPQLQAGVRIRSEAEQVDQPPVHRLEDWIGPRRAGSEPPRDRDTAETSPDWPVHLNRPITEYQPSEYGDFPPALVGGATDLASVATVASRHWLTEGSAGRTGRPDVRPWADEPTRHRQDSEPGDGSPPHRLQTSHLWPPSDTARVTTAPDGATSSLSPGVVAAESDSSTPDGGAGRPARPSPPQLVPFVDRPSLELPQYDRSPWRPVLASSRRPQTAQLRASDSPPSETGGLHSVPGLQRVTPGPAAFQPEEIHRGPAPIAPAEEGVHSGPHPTPAETEQGQTRPAVDALHHQTVLPVALWPRPSPPKFQLPSQQPTASPANASVKPSPKPGVGHFGVELLQLMSDFILSRNKPDTLSRTEPGAQVPIEQSQDPPQSQSQPSEAQSEPQLNGQSHSQSQNQSHDQSLSTSDKPNTESSPNPPTVTVVYKSAPATSPNQEAAHGSGVLPSGEEADAHGSGVLPSGEEAEVTTETGSGKVTADMRPAEAELTRAPSTDPSVPPVLVITYSARNSTSSPIKPPPAPPPVFLPDTLVRKTLTIISQNETGDSRFVTHPSGIISRSPLSSHDLDPVTSEHHIPLLPPTTAFPDQVPHRPGVSTADVHLGLTEDGELVTTLSPTTVRTVPPHLHYRVVADTELDQLAAPAPLSTPQQVSPAPDDAAVTVTASSEDGWEDRRVTRPSFQPVTSYSGVYPPSRPKPPSEPLPDYDQTYGEFADTSIAGGNGDDYFYYDTEIFTEKNSVKSIFDMFSTRKPLVLNTDVVTSTSVQEGTAPERRLLRALLRAASRHRQAVHRATKVPAVAVTDKDGKASPGVQNNGADPETPLAINERDSLSANASASSLRQRRSLSWLSFPREGQLARPEPAGESRQRALPTPPRLAQAPGSPPRAAMPQHAAPASTATSSSHAALARRVRRPPYSSQSVASLAARLRLAATPTARPRRGSRVRLSPRREKLADRLMRFRGVRSRGIFATTARPARRWWTKGATRLPNSAPIQVVEYDEGASVDDILDRIFETRREVDTPGGASENEVGSADGHVGEVAKESRWKTAGGSTATTSSVLWRADDKGDSWAASEPDKDWAPVKDSIRWPTRRDEAATEQADSLDGAGRPSSSDREVPSLSENLLRPPSQKTDSSRGGSDRTTTAPPTAAPRPTASSRRPHLWRPVRVRLPTPTGRPAATEPPRLADKLSRLTTTPGPAAADAQLVADTDNEVGTAGRPAAAAPTRPTLASLLSNYTYLEDGLTPPAAGCPADQFRCVSGECVPRLSRCDMLQDCADGSDELGCTCADRLLAQFLERKICDGVIDCHDSTDEQFCDWCRPGQFICPGAKLCVDTSTICDGQYDCPDGADEQQCVTLATTRGAAGQRRYQSAGYLMVRKRGRWGPLCVDNFDALVRQTHTAWNVQELGRAVCTALTYNDTKHVVRAELSPISQQQQTKPKQEAFYQLVLSADAPRNHPDDTSLVFEEATCPRRTSIHISCDNLKCGLRPRVKQRQARIVGGTNASPGAWPWQAAMYRDGEYQCGATLISDRWLLSAGHCFLRSTTNHWVARLGAYRRGSTLLSPFESLHVVSHIIVHPDYEPIGYVNDIALLKLADTVSMNDFARPVCLPPARAEVVEGALCSVVGWGQLFESGRIFPDTLQEVELPLISSQQCKKRTSRLPLYKITDDMFCAGFDRGGRDACLGDSGGPLMCQEPTGEWTLTGITSNGYGCARALRPGVYTKVANYISWIEDVTTGPLPRGRRSRCRGHRCPLGRCLEEDKVCDGVVDCADGSDEQECAAVS